MKTKKLICSCSSIVLVMCILIISCPIISTATTNGKTSADAVVWANNHASNGSVLDYDGVYGAQCVDLIKYYYVFLGNDAVNGNGKDYATNSLPSGWTRIQYYSGFVPQPGDVAVWTTGGGGNGHVAIVISANASTMTVVEQNWVGQYCSSRSNASTSGIWGVIRPDFAPVTNTDVVTFDSTENSDVTQTNAVISTWVNNTGRISEMGYYLGMSDEYQIKVPMNTASVEWTRFHLNYSLNDSYGKLNPGQRYTYVFYVISDGVEYHSEVGHFTTSGTSGISFDTYSVDELTDTSAVLSAWLDNSSSATISSLGMVYGKGINEDSGTFEITNNISWSRAYLSYDTSGYVSLNACTGYYFRYYAVSAGVTYYSDYIPITTCSPQITFDTQSISEITYNSATISTWFSNDYEKNISSLGFDLGTSTSALTKYEVSKDITWTRAHLQYDISQYAGKLTSNTTYYYRFYIIANGAAYHTDVMSFKTDAAPTYTISFDANGGTGAPASQTKTHDVTLTLSSTQPTRSLYNFKGWATSSTATSAAYQAGGPFTTNADTTLYAVWEFVCANGHNYSYKVSTSPTTSETGKLTGTCSQCSGTTTVTLPKLNTTDYTYKVVTEATCTMNGTGRYTWNMTTYGSYYFDVVLDKIDHTYQSVITAPTCTEQGCHIHTCANCGDSYQDSFTDALGHNWDEGVVTMQPTAESEGVMTYTCTRCGETRMESIPVLEPEFNVTYSSVSLSLNGDIGVNYYMDLSQDITNDSGTYMEFTVNGVSQRVPLSEATLDSNGNYKFSCRVAAKQMTDTIVSQMYTSDGPVGASKEYSVQQYCNAVIDNYSQNAAYDNLIALLKAMVNYGAYAQLEFGYHIDNLANANLPEDEKGLPDNLELDAYAHSIVGSEEGIKVYSASLILESETVIRFYFQLTGDKTIEEYTFVINGKAMVPELSRDGTYYVDVPNISAKDLDTFYTVSVGGLRVSYCGISYVRMTLNYSGSSETLKELVRAVYAYNQAANTYFGA